MRVLRIWLWRAALAPTGYACAFFAWFMFAPFETVGPPEFDTAFIRTHAWESWGVLWAQFIGAGLWLLLALTAGAWGRGIKAALAALLLFLALLAMANEFGSLIEYGDLRDTAEVARHKLMVSRSLTLGLAWASLALGIWARPNPAG